MSRRLQDTLTFAVGIGLLGSQVVGYFLGLGEAPYLTAAGLGCLGIIPIRKAQDSINDRKD